MGCAQRPARTLPLQPQSQKLTLLDLKPTNASKAQPQIAFEIITFELPKAKVQEIGVALASFIPKGVRFRDESLFSKNGLFLFRGKSDERGQLTQQLRLLNAKRTMRTTLMTLDKTAELFPTNTFPVERYIFSVSYGDQSTAQAFLPGQIGWMITPALTLRRDAVEVNIAPVYAPFEGASIRLAAGRNEYGETPFPQGQFNLTMQEGDFVILAPSRAATQTSLDKMLFEPSEKKDVIQLYVIVFIRADQE
jgi:hypothetical protein